MAAILRVKRKASDEPADGLLIAIKKPKCCLPENVNEVLFKFAATLQSENESVKDHIQAVLLKEKVQRCSKWRNPKNISRHDVKQVAEKLKAEHKAANEKKKLDLLNNRRLIFAETLPFEEDSCPDAEVRKLFHLYDIIEENEEIKKQVDDSESIITCNGQPMIREKAADYVYDVYISDRHIDNTFVDNTISVRPCSLTVDDIYSGESDDSDEIYDDEDDSNDENNWRNDYPDESSSEKDNDSESDTAVHHENEMYDAFENFAIDDDGKSSCSETSFDYSRVLQELTEEAD